MPKINSSGGATVGAGTSVATGAGTSVGVAVAAGWQAANSMAAKSKRLANNHNRFISPPNSIDKKGSGIGSAQQIACDGPSTRRSNVCGVTPPSFNVSRMDLIPSINRLFQVRVQGWKP